MKIDLNFTEEQSNYLLAKNGYEIDSVLMWFFKYPYDARENIVKESEMGKYYVKVAYPKGMDCGWKHEEKPLLENYKKFEYNTVVEKLINELIFKKIL